MTHMQTPADATITNPNLPFATLAGISQDKYVWANNHTTPQDVLDDLARTGNEIIQAAVAANPNTSPETLCFLAKSPVIRWAVVLNTQAPIDLIRDILGDNQLVTCDMVEALRRVLRTVEPQDGG